MELMILTPEVYGDERGHLFESFSQATFEQAIGEKATFVQDNHSQSREGVIRGLHYQLPPASQGKLVRVARGAIFDVAVDLRRSSPTFGEWEGHVVSEENRLQLWIPPGFAHGFLALTEPADVLYKLTAYHDPDLARSIRWDDPEIGIEWPLDGREPIISSRDKAAPSLFEADTFD